MVTNKCSPEQMNAISEEKTRIELEKLHRDIKNENNQDYVSETSNSDIETDTNYNSISMETRMYIDNQNLWKKNHILNTKIEKLNNKLRYLNYEYNNSCVDISDLKNDLAKYKNYKYLKFYINILHFVIIFHYIESNIDFYISNSAKNFVKNFIFSLYKAYIHS